QEKITFADMREQGVCGLLVYCADYRCSHSIAISGDRWPGDLRLSDIEPRFICGACGHRGADVRPYFNWNRQTVKMMGYRVLWLFIWTACPNCQRLPNSSFQTSALCGNNNRHQLVDFLLRRGFSSRSW